MQSFVHHMEECGIGSDLVKAALDVGHNVIATARNTDSISSEVGDQERPLPLAMAVTDSMAIDEAISPSYIRNTLEI